MRALFFIILTLCSIPSSLWAEGWSPLLAPRLYLPAQFLAVDKELQKAFLIRTSADSTQLDKFREVHCTTGMRTGDKLIENDLKTPDGVYFLERKVTTGLDFNRFGNSAYPLNYPNPVDRIHGKTGNGILIHGRGRIFGPRQTLGCVVLENSEVDNLDKHIQISGTPIFIGEKISWSRQIAIPSEVIMGTVAWARTRESKDEAFFNLYDVPLFEKSSGKPFSRFKEQVRLEQGRTTWADIRTGRITIVDGPDYVVTVFQQQTASPGGYQEGWRRLYWMRRADLWKIVGEEWVPHSFGGERQYRQNVTAEIAAAFQKAAHAWDAGNFEELSGFYESDAMRRTIRGRDAILQTLKTDRESGSTNPYQGTPQVNMTSRGVEVVLLTANQSRTFLFRPGDFDSWSVVEER